MNIKNYWESLDSLLITFAVDPHRTRRFFWNQTSLDERRNKSKASLFHWRTLSTADPLVTLTSVLRIREPDPDLNCDFKWSQKGLLVVKHPRSIRISTIHQIKRQIQRTLMRNNIQRELSDIDVHPQAGYFFASEASDLQHFLIIGHCGGELRALKTSPLTLQNILLVDRLVSLTDCLPGLKF